MDIFNNNVSILGEFTIASTNAIGSFLTIDSAGIVRFRLPSEVSDDIGIDTSLLVPYIGATTTVDLGSQDFTTAGTGTFNRAYSQNEAIDNNELVRLDQMNSVIAGLHWQVAVLDKIDFTTSEPSTPTDGDRYINTVTGTSSVTTQTVTEDYIYEWNGTDWTETIPEEGYTLWDINDDTNYTYNGTAWVEFGSTVSHNNTTGLQGGTSGEYYHLTSDQYSNLAYTNVGNVFSVDQIISTGEPKLTLEDNISAINTSLEMSISSSGVATISQTTDVGTGYLNIQADRYLSLQAGTLIYTQNQFRFYDTGSLTLGSGGDFKQNYDSTNDVLNIKASVADKGLVMDIDGGVTVEKLAVVDLDWNSDSVSVLVQDEVLGYELVVNGDFDTDSDWVKVSESTISGGTGNIISTAGVDSSIYQDILTIGKNYKLEFDIVSIVSGSLKLENGSSDLIFTEVGSQSVVITSEITLLQFKRSAGVTDISIDNVSVKEVTASTDSIQKRALGSSAFTDTVWETNSVGINYNDGDVGIGNTAPNEALDVTGNIAVSGTVDGIDVGVDVTANNAKISYTDASAVSLNTAKDTNVSTDLGGTATTTNLTITSSDGTGVTVGGANSSIAGVLTSAKFDEIGVNNSKVGVTDEEANTINSETTGEPTGSDVILNIVSLTQAEYNAGTPVTTTTYIITDA